MKNTVLLYGLLLCLGLTGRIPLSAQTFRRVTKIDQLETGARYLLAGHCRKTPDSVFVMVSPDKTGTGVKNIAARKLKPDANGGVQVADGGTAIFELVKENTAYAFRETVSGSWLAYSTKKSVSNTPLYIMTDEELESMPVKPKEKFSKKFAIRFNASESSKKAILYTHDEVYTSSTVKEEFCLLVDGISAVFKLYLPKGNYADSVFLFKEERQSPVVEQTAQGDWNFKGDWTVEDLFRMDFSQAGRIDFTEISLPVEGSLPETVKLPEDFVWTYVRKGEGKRLPVGWQNVVEIDRKDKAIQGRAVTSVWGDDRLELGSKYSFTAAEGICWYRHAAGDDGWSTVGLPFEVHQVTKEAPDGEMLAVERMEFEKISSEGAVFRMVGEDDPWLAGRAYLWRIENPQAVKVCFSAKGVTVRKNEGMGNENGFYASFARQDIGALQTDVFLLDDSGKRFVRAAAGSWIAPCRGALKWNGNAQMAVRLIGTDNIEQVDGEEEVVDNTPVPVYSLEGKRMGEMRPGTPLPAGIPAGIYVTPRGKFIKK